MSFQRTSSVSSAAHPAHSAEHLALIEINHSSNYSAKLKTNHHILPMNLSIGLHQSEDDERYRYLLTNGIVRSIEDENKIIFAELPQIPGVLVVYRKPSERAANPERL